MVRLASPGVAHDELFLPWVESTNDRRFKKTVTRIVVFFIVVSAIVTFLPVPEIVQKDIKAVSPRISRLILEQKKQPPPPPPVVEKAIKKKKTKPKPKKKVDKKQAAYKKAASSGLVALSNELVDLRDSFDFSSVSNKPLTKSKGVEKQSFKKDVITSKATTTSAGIDTKKLSRTTAGSDLSSRKTTKVSSDIGDKVVASRRTSAGGNKLLRDEREIEQVFQKNKGAIYSIYNRALRKDPSLEGKVVVELTIDPSGKVTMCRVVSSDLNAPDLERKIVARVKLFKFPPSNAGKTTIKYPIDFLAS